jgi:hypothetical protein
VNVVIAVVTEGFDEEDNGRNNESHKANLLTKF